MTAAGRPVASGQSRLGRWRAFTVGYLVVGYAGYYLCRSNFSVSMPYLLDDLESSGWGRDAAMSGLGLITSMGTLAYALGKFGGGAMADAFGGRRNILGGMAGSAGCTFLLAATGNPWVFGLAWVSNRLLQSFGWPGMVKVVSRWFTPARYGTVMGVVSLSFLFGDAASKAFMGWLFANGLGWRGVFGVAGGVLGAILLVGAWGLKESPESIGEEPPGGGPPDEVAPEAEAEGGRPPMVRLLSSPTFCLVCLLSFALTLVRETFNNWTPTYFVDAVGLSKPRAASLSGLFPLAGGVSVLLAGVLADGLGRRGRMLLISVGLASGGATLAALASGGFGGSKATPVGLVMLAGFLLIGPYSYLAGAVSLDFGGRDGGATASGLVDGVGYLGGILAGSGVAAVVHRAGWGASFALLAALTWGASLLAGFLFLSARGESR